MQYMLLIYGSDERWEALSEEERTAQYQEYFKLSSDLQERGAYVSAHELQPASTATVVRVRDDEPVVTDGPFAETKETLGGYYLVEAESLDEAIEWASRIPAARGGGAIEVRPVVMREAEVEA